MYRVHIKIEDVAPPVRQSMRLTSPPDRTVLELVTEQGTALGAFEMIERVIQSEMLATKLRAEEEVARKNTVREASRRINEATAHIPEDDEPEDDTHDPRGVI